jgi:hypothetical protein
LHCPFGEGGCHKHTLYKFDEVASGDLTAPEHDYPTFIELVLTATDARGLAASSTVKLAPDPVELTFLSNPPGITLTAGLLNEATPFTATVVKNSNITLAAPGTTNVGGTTYAWQGWSDGGGRVHNVLARCSATFTATYAAGTVPSGGGSTQTDPCQEAPQGEGPKSGEPPKEAPKEGPPSKVPPKTKLGKHPPKHTKSKAAKFSFSASEPHSHFRCKLDKGKYRACSSPEAYVGLKPGKHVFRVYAVGADGLSDKSPSNFVWHVVA